LGEKYNCFDAQKDDFFVVDAMIHNDKIKGNAVYETSSSTSVNTSWFSDGSDFPISSRPWLAHGGLKHDNTRAGIFAFSCDTGHYQAGYSEGTEGFCPTLIIL
ncbi:MAG: hypothetical protein RSF67_09060, partial [Clostridia bacterium]